MAAKLNDGLRDILKAVPSKFIREACGNRQVAHLQRMASRWGCPLSGKSVDLYNVLGWLWDFLVTHGPTLKAVIETSNAETDGPLAVQLVKARIAKVSADARMAELRLEQKNGHLLDRDKVHAMLELLVARIHRASDRAQSQWGADGYEFVAGLVEGFVQDIAAVRGSEAAGEQVAAPQAAEADDRSGKTAGH